MIETKPKVKLQPCTAVSSCLALVGMVQQHRNRMFNQHEVSCLPNARDDSRWSKIQMFVNVIARDYGQ